MQNDLLKRARARRILALDSLRSAQAENIFLPEAERRRPRTAPVPTFTSARGNAANLPDAPAMRRAA